MPTTHPSAAGTIDALEPSAVERTLMGRGYALGARLTFSGRYLTTAALLSSCGPILSKVSFGRMPEFSDLLLTVGALLLALAAFWYWRDARSFFIAAGGLDVRGSLRQGHLRQTVPWHLVESVSWTWLHCRVRLVGGAVVWGVAVGPRRFVFSLARRVLG